MNIDNRPPARTFITVAFNIISRKSRTQSPKPDPNLVWKKSLVTRIPGIRATCSIGYVTVVTYYVTTVNCCVIIDNAQCKCTCAVCAQECTALCCIMQLAISRTNLHSSQQQNKSCIGVLLDPCEGAGARLTPIPQRINILTFLFSGRASTAGFLRFCSEISLSCN